MTANECVLSVVKRHFSIESTDISLLILDELLSVDYTTKITFDDILRTLYKTEHFVSELVYVTFS